MTKIEYICGDLFELYPKDKNVIIPHVCNDIGGWGSGFVVPLGRHFPLSKERYLRWFNGDNFDECNFPNRVWFGHYDTNELGSVQFVQINKNIVVANMIAQNGVISQNNSKPIKYLDLCLCMEDVAWEASRSIDKKKRYEIHAPKFGSGLAGGNWDFIEELIQEIWCARDIPVTIYSLDKLDPKEKALKDGNV